MSEVPQRRWFQFTISRVLLATFWMGVSLSVFALSGWYKEPDHNPPLLIALVATMVLSPFVAVGTLFGHPFRGLLAGIVLIGGYALAVYIALDNGWIGFP